MEERVKGRAAVSALTILQFCSSLLMNSGEGEKGSQQEASSSEGWGGFLFIDGRLSIAG
jgi:hypothetical protein